MRVSFEISEENPDKINVLTNMVMKMIPEKSKEDENSPCLDSQYNNLEADPTAPYIRHITVYHRIDVTKNVLELGLS
jgi:hypothetical protein